MAAVLFLALAAGCGGPGERPTPEPTEMRTIVHCAPEFVPLSDTMGDMVRDLALPGGALLLVHGKRVVCEGFYGAYNSSTAVPVVSAAKWLSAATVLALVDDGSLTLDDPVSAYLPYFAGEHGAITLRQLLAHTSGLPPYSDCMFDSRLTLDACAQEIASLDLLAPPGAEFRYGGAAYTVAGRVAEVASGMSWGALFRARLAGPLGLNATDYGSTRNPLLSEGYVVSSLHDYGLFLQMVLDGGSAGDRQVLSGAAIAEMLRDQTAGATVASSPRGEDVAYGLGVWLERVGPAGEVGQASSPGAGGFVPWIDFERNLVGVFMVADQIDRVWETALAVQQRAREIVDGQEGSGQAVQN